MEFEKELIATNLLQIGRLDLQKFYDFNLLSVRHIGKKASLSIDNRMRGNILFKKKTHSTKEHEKVWKFYTLSIATATIDSEELAAGYANRSALLEHLGKYEESIKDIDRALRITALNSLKVKLYCRKTKCYLNLQEDNPGNCLKKAKYWLNKINNDEKNKSILIKMVTNTEHVLEKNIHPSRKRKKKYNIQCTNNAFSISYDKKYGRCLIASRDIKPGEFIHTENFYVTCVNPRKTFAYCNYCLSISWTNIPCHTCPYVMYCSENCREIAWTKYHSIECYICISVLFPYNYLIKLSLRSLIIGINEIGGIENIKCLIKNFEDCKDKNKNILKNEIFDMFNFKHVLSLNYSKNYSNIYPYLIKYSIHIAFCLLQIKQFKQICGEKFTDNSSKEFDQIHFIGALLLRLNCILKINTFPVIDYSLYCKSCVHTEFCSCVRGMGLSPFSSLINHNCNNNIDKVFTTDGKVIYFSLHKIKKNMQLFSNYYMSYMETVLLNRQRVLNHAFELNCDCIPCQKNWPTFKIFNQGYLNINPEVAFKDKKVKALFLKYSNYVLTVFNKYNQHSKKFIEDYKKDIEILLENTLSPSLEYNFIILSLRNLYYQCYGNKVQIPKCKNKL